MNDSRYEIYSKRTNGLPFVLNENLTRTRTNVSRTANWHENLEIQLCKSGEGSVLIDGERHPFRPGDVAVIDSNALHHTGSNASVTYSCIIIDVDFCSGAGIEPSAIKFVPIVRDERVASLFCRVASLAASNEPFRLAKINIALTELLVALAERYASSAFPAPPSDRRDVVKAALLFIRENYSRRFTIADVAKAVSFDKFALCREFKRLTGQTIVQNANALRCVKAADFLARGNTVTETAALCGFENLSYFTKTFKLYVGALPVSLRKRTPLTE